MPLRGRIQFKGEYYWGTGLAEPYPAPWGVRYGLVAREALAMRKAATYKGEPTPMASKDDDGWPLLTKGDSSLVRWKTVWIGHWSGNYPTTCCLM